MTGLLLYVLERKDRFAEEVKVFWKGIWNLSFVLSELAEELAEYIASEVVLATIYLNESCTPEEVGSIVCVGRVFDRKFVSGEEILAEEGIVTILQV